MLNLMGCAMSCCVFARSRVLREEWRSCRHFVRRDAGCDGLSRLHRTAIRQHFKFHLKPRDLVCIKKMPVHLKRFYDRHQCLKMGQLIAAVVAGWSSRVGGTGTTPRRGAHPRSRDLNFIVFRLTLKRMLNGAVVVTFVYR